jgi:hypothetical protein
VGGNPHEIHGLTSEANDIVKATTAPRTLERSHPHLEKQRLCGPRKRTYIRRRSDFGRRSAARNDSRPACGGKAT